MDEELVLKTSDRKRFGGSIPFTSAMKNNECPNCSSTKIRTIGLMTFYTLSTETTEKEIWTFGCANGHTWKVTHVNNHG